MISSFGHFINLTTRFLRKCDSQSSFQAQKLANALSFDFCLKNQKQNFHTNTPRMYRETLEDRRHAARSDAKKEGQVTQIFKGDLRQKREQGYFPGPDLPTTLFEGKPFKELPVVLIEARKNNTHLTLVDQGLVKIYRTCGTEGFKHTRKGTNVAAQTAGSALALRAIKKGIKVVRVIVGGLGPGRLSSIKGLQLCGMKIISITDNTVDHTHLRPRKQKRL